ncbi:LOW QUALITY PROTEIN: uncharacterized protein J5F26_015499 [Ciconia maguari]
MASDPFNHLNSSSSSFILVGVPSLEAFPTCLGILFCSGYIIALVGNGVVLLVIGLDNSLRDPIHCFLGMLAIIDVVMVTSIIPKMLSVLWLNSTEIGYMACFVQMFFVHSTTSEESGVLLAMAVDRYVAICHPLRYQAILNRQTIAQIGLAIVVRALLFMVPLTGMVTNLPYCRSRVVPHSYCEHMAVAKLACADPRPSGLYSVAGSSLIVGMDMAFIAVSYGMILKTVLGKKSCRKAFSTCGCHICVMLLYYVPGIVSIYTQQFGSGISMHAQVLLADLYLTLPTMLNPIVYSMRTKQIRQGTRVGNKDLAWPTCAMSTANRSNTNSSSFLLTGIPGLEALHVWFSIPFCFTYVMTLLGNSMVLLAVRLNKSLHEPMYYFISMLAVIDLIFSTAVVPKMLGVFWLDSREIGFEACFIQMFFIHTFTAVESGVLLAMSFDRYIAICNPLRYTTILTSSRTIQMGLLSLARGAGVMTPLMCLLTSLPYCKTRVIPHSYCEHMAVVELACTDPSVSDLYSLIVATLLVGTDSVFITFSYGMILRSVMRLPSQEARLKALRTCGSHVSIILLFYIGGLLSMYLQMFSFGLAPHVQVLVADFYLTVPPMLNPLIYGIKMKQIQEGIFKLWQLAGLSISQADKDSSSTFVPKMLLGFLFHLSHISWGGGCVAQICCDDAGIRGAPVPLERHQALCEQMALVSLSRGDTSRNKMDNPYSPENCTWEMQRKACHTSATRLVVILVTDLSSSTVYHTGKSVSEDVHNLISVTYLLLPCGINPIIYGVRTKEIREHLLKLLKKENLMHDHGQGHGCSLKISLSQSKLLLLRKDGPFLSRSYPPPPICWHEQSQGSTVHSNKSDSFLD